MNRRGFTLIEVLVTVAILGILAMVAVTNFSGTNNNKALETFTRQLAADLQSIQQKVSNGSTNYGIMFTTTGYSVMYGSGYSDAEKTVNFPVNVSYDQATSGFTYSTVSVPVVYAPVFQADASMKTQDVARTNVLPYGSAADVANVNYWTAARIIVTNTPTKTKTVRVVTATGAIMIQ